MSREGAIAAKKSIEDMAEDLERVEAAIRDADTVTLKDGSKVSIYKCKTKNISAVLHMVSNIMQDLGVKDLAGGVGIDLNDPAAMLMVLAKSTTSILEVAGDLCSLSHEELAELEIDDSLKIVMKIVEVNQAFFFKSVAPLLQFELPAMAQSENQKT